MKRTLLVTLLIISYTQAFAENYRIIIDAGSSGSKLHLFQYETIENNPTIKDVFSENNKIPLSSFEKNPENAGASLQVLLNDALVQLKNKSIDPKKVQINILATAGMRLLSEDKQAEIYKNVTTYLQQHYTFQIGKLQTITGKMEGLYAWLDVNYLANTFQNHTPSVGAIDMGGASTQISFETNDQSKPEDLSSLKINGQTYTVFSKSFLGLGQDQARDQMNTLPASESCYPVGYPMQQSQLSTGAWDFTKCATLYTQVINTKKVIEQMISTSKQSFYIFSGAYYTYQFFNADQTPNHGRLEKNIQSICTQSWDKLKNDYPTENDNYLSSYCSNATYLDNLFYEVYQLKGKHLQVVKQVNNQNIDWALGAMLYSLNS